MKYNKPFTDFIGRHIVMEGVKGVGYVWGGEPAHTFDAPDRLYVTLHDEELDVPTTLARIVHVTETTEQPLKEQPRPDSKAS